MIGGGFAGSFPRRGNAPGQAPKLGVVHSVSKKKTTGKHRSTLGLKKRAGQPIADKPRPPQGPHFGRIEVTWNGVIHGVSGYSKANREILKRIIPFSTIRLASEMTWDAQDASQEVQELFSHHKSVEVGSGAPRITFLPPKNTEPPARHRVIYTMMETQEIHGEMIRLMNENYEECWTPTRWNADSFKKCGLKLPIRVIPLGVDPAIYTPNLPKIMPEATLISTQSAGRTEIPRGFIFVYVFQPSFRKGVEFLLSAFEEAFYADAEAGLILGTTAYSDEMTKYPFKNMKTRVWALNGKYTESDLSSMYRACQAYVCTSRGEGWNLPLMEAAACGIPVIAPRTSVHPELIPAGHGLLFDADGYKVFKEGKRYSKWFDGIPFPDYGYQAKRTLVDLLRGMKKNYTDMIQMGKNYSSHIRSRYTWGSSARMVSERLRELFK